MRTRWLRLLGCFAALLPQLGFAEENESTDFRDILEIAEVGPDVLAQLGEGPDYNENDWRVLLQVASRLEQFGDPNPSASFAAGISRIDPANKKEALGRILRIGGIINSVEERELPTSLQKLSDRKKLYLCQIRFFVSERFGTGGATVLSTSVPQAWQNKSSFDERVSIRGVLVQLSATDGLPILLTNHIAWYPDKDAPSGQLLLAKHGMDIGLLDEVRHRQPFVKPSISREGEAFYAALAAISETDPREIVKLAKENVAPVVEKWRAAQPELQRKHRTLEDQLAQATDSGEREKLDRKIKRVKNERALAATVVKQAEAGQSSVAPMFLQPEHQVGELCLFTGTARRAVWIAAPEKESLRGYFELEVYPNELRILSNQPVVCCVTSLPEGFPRGDEIREPVRVAGVFFKLWRYRSRELQAESPLEVVAGQTGEQRQLYTPVVVANTPLWLKTTTSGNSRAALWAGMGFLALLLTLWMVMAWLACRDRQSRAALRPRETIDL